AAGQEGVEESPGRLARVVAVAILRLLGEDPVLEPVQELIAVRAEDPDLGEMDVPVDEAGEDQPAFQVGDLDARVPSRDLREVPEVDDQAVLDDHQTVEGEAGGVLLMPDILPGVVDEVEERPSDHTSLASHRRNSGGFWAGRRRTAEAGPGG